MTAKQLSKKTIKSNKFTIGKIIRGKGIEIFHPDKQVFYTFRELNENDLEKFKELKDLDSNTLYIESYYLNGVWSGDKTYDTQDMPFEEFFKSVLKNPKSFSSIKVNQIGKKLGYIPLSKYKSSRESQIELCKDLIIFQKQSTYGGDTYEDYYDAVTYNNLVINFNKNDGFKDYSIEHGNNLCPLYDRIHFNGRINNYNEFVINDYKFDEGGYLKELDPNETISVYHRKAKDWYIWYSLELTEMTICYKTYDYPKNNYEDDMVFFLTYKENPELLTKVEEFLKSEKEDLEIRCFIKNELDEDCDYRQSNIINFKALDLMYEDISILEEEILNFIEWDYEKTETNFDLALNKVFSSKIKVDDNLKVTIKKSTYCGDEVTKYNHLALLKRLEKRYNYELVQSAISETISTVTWAIKQDNEEFHFSLIDVIGNDVSSNETLKDFIIRALDAINIRKLEKIKEVELYEKASKVFVGIEDSLSSGNCEFGTKQFIVKHHIDTSSIGGIRGDILLDMDKSHFLLRAVSYAIANHV